MSLAAHRDRQQRRAKDRDLVRRIIRRYGPRFVERLGIGSKVPITEQRSLQGGAQ